MSSVSVNIPCVPFPEVPELPNIKLIGGVELGGFLDFSVGMPTQCSVTMNLMAQLAPVLAGLAPILNILAVLKALADFASNPLVKGPDLIAAINKIAGLFISLTPAGIAVTIKGVLTLLINFLNCFISQLEASVKFQADLGQIQQSIELDPSLATPVLTASLSCAQANAEISMQQAMASLGPVKPLLDIVGVIAGIAGLPLELPDMSVGADADMAGLIASMREATTSLQSVIEGLPA